MQHAGSPPSCFVMSAASSSASTAPGRAERATLKRMAVALLGAGLVLPNASVVHTMDRDIERAEPAFGWRRPPGSGCQVAQWHAAHGVRLDEDFAFAYHDLLVDARCRRPRGELTSARQTEWQASVRRLVDNHATSAEASAFKNVIRTLQELYHFQILRGRTQGLEEINPIDLDAFLHGGTSAPT